MVNSQTWLDQWYPPKETCLRENGFSWINNFGKRRSEITALFIAGKNLEGHLDLRDFSNLEELRCHDNQLTNLDLSGNVNLRKLNCVHNQLTTIEFLNTLPRRLTLYNNNIQPT